VFLGGLGVKIIANCFEDMPPLNFHGEQTVEQKR